MWPRSVAIANFLRDLGARELNFDSYLHDHLPQALQQHPDIPSDARHYLLQLLAARLGEIRDDAALQHQLQPTTPHRLF